MKYKVAVVGAAGFAGAEAVRILLNHPSFELVCITSDANKNIALSSMYPSFEGASDLVFEPSDAVLSLGLDAAFLAVPHTASLGLTPKLLDAGITVIDLSADYRLKDASVYEKWYGVTHTDASRLNCVAFGLPELSGDEMALAAEKHNNGEAVLVACAGCYPTATSLAAAPIIKDGLLKNDSLVVADAISGVTGAGKKASERTHFCFANENVEAYGVATHRHTPEIEQILGIENQLVFTPHLAPLNRGLLSTVTIKLDMDALSHKTDNPKTYLQDLYSNLYKDSPFVKILPAGMQPKTSSVNGTNNAHVGVAYNDNLQAAIATCAIDNLGKGAAGQAVQCANIVFGLSQNAGLNEIAEAV